MITVSTHKERLDALPRPITKTVSVYAGNVIDDLRNGKKLTAIRENDSVLTISLLYWNSASKFTKLINANCVYLIKSSKSSNAFFDEKLNLTFHQKRITKYKPPSKTYYYTFEGDCIQNFIFENYDKCRLLRIDTHQDTTSRIYFKQADKLKHLFVEKGVWRDNRLVFYYWEVNLTFVRVYDDLDAKLPQNIQKPLLSHVPRVRPVTVMPKRESKKRRIQTLVFRGKIADYRQILNDKPISITHLTRNASQMYYNNDALQLAFNFDNKGENMREYRVYYEAERDLTFAQMRCNRILVYSGKVNNFDNIAPCRIFETSYEAASALYGNDRLISILPTNIDINKTDTFDYWYNDANNITCARLRRDK